MTLHGLPINSNKVLEPDSQPEEAWQVPAKTQREPLGDPLEKVGLEEPVPAEYNISLRTTVETIAEVDWQQDAGIGVLHSLVPDPSLAFSGTVVHSRDVAAAARNTAHPAPRNVTVPAGIHVPSNGHGIAAERTPQTLAGLAGVDKQSPVIGNKYHISQSGNVYEKAPDRLMPATPPGARPQTLAQSAAVQLNVSLPAPAMTGSASTTVGGAQVPIMTNVVPHEIAHAIVNASGDQSASATASRAISAFASSPIARPAKSIELQLVPRSLGVVDIKIVNNSGQMTVMMVTSTAEAETLLRSEIGQLQDAIRSLGTLIEDVKVTVQQQTAQENGPGRDGRNLDAQMMQFGEHGEANGSFRDEELSESNSDVNSTTAGTVFPDEDPDATQLRDGIYL